MAVAIDFEQRAETELNDVLARYTAGEGAVVRAFFSQPRKDAEYLETVLRQTGREVQIAHWLPALAGLGKELERTVDRWRLYHQVHEMADELKHHALLADLAEWLAGRKLGADELRKYEVNAFWDDSIDDYYLHNPHLPEAARMVDVTRELASTVPEPIWKGVVKISEGGGGQAFVEASKVDGDEFQRRFAVVMGSIAQDEMGHGPEYVGGFVREQIHSEEDLRVSVEALIKIMAQHLRVRNEIYGYPLTEERLRSYDKPKEASR